MRRFAVRGGGIGVPREMRAHGLSLSTGLARNPTHRRSPLDWPRAKPDRSTKPTRLALRETRPIDEAHSTGLARNPTHRRSPLDWLRAMRVASGKPLT